MEIPRTTLVNIGGGVMHSTVQIMATLLATEEPQDRAWLIAKIIRHFDLNLIEIAKGLTKEEQAEMDRHIKDLEY